jgi:hypothetical protein|nr:MAG TPA: hypothetical protein [Caudoviricetes sp.]
MPYRNPYSYDPDWWEKVKKINERNAAGKAASNAACIAGEYQHYLAASSSIDDDNGYDGGQNGGCCDD